MKLSLFYSIFFIFCFSCATTKNKKKDRSSPLPVNVELLYLLDQDPQKDQELNLTVPSMWQKLWSALGYTSESIPAPTKPLTVVVPSPTPVRVGQPGGKIAIGETRNLATVLAEDKYIRSQYSKLKSSSDTSIFRQFGIWSRPEDVDYGDIVVVKMGDEVKEAVAYNQIGRQIEVILKNGEKGKKILVNLDQIGIAYQPRKAIISGQLAVGEKRQPDFLLSEDTFLRSKYENIREEMAPGSQAKFGFLSADQITYGQTVVIDYKGRLRQAIAYNQLGNMVEVLVKENGAPTKTLVNSREIGLSYQTIHSANFVEIDSAHLKSQYHFSKRLWARLLNDLSEWEYVPGFTKSAALVFPKGKELTFDERGQFIQEIDGAAPGKIYLQRIGSENIVQLKFVPKKDSSAVARVRLDASEYIARNREDYENYMQLKKKLQEAIALGNPEEIASLSDSLEKNSFTEEQALRYSSTLDALKSAEALIDELADLQRAENPSEITARKEAWDRSTSELFDAYFVNSL